MRRLVLILCLSIGVIGHGTPAWADSDTLLPGRLPDPSLAAPKETRHSLRSASPSMTPSEAARQVQRRHGGRVLAVQPDGAGYRVKMLKDGEVRIYLVSP